MSRQHATAAALFLALSVLMTWPLAPNLGRAVSDPGDPFINLWILDWDYWATFHQPLSLFHANAFHPARYTLAFSENLYGIALFLFPLRALGASAITGYNVALLAGFAFSGFGAYLLVRWLTGSGAAGMAAGVFYAFVPFRFVHVTHVQHVVGGWLPLLLYALLRYAARPSRRRALVFAAVFVLNGLTNIHYLFFGALACAITAALLIPRAAWRELLLAMAGAALVLAPFLYPYYAASKLYGMERSWEEVSRFSAVAADWLPGATDPEKKLDPGLLAYAVALLALIVARKEKAQLALALLWAAIGFLGSLGLNFTVHEFLFGAVPGFRSIRVPARWAVIAYIGLAMLIGLFTAALGRRNRWLAWIVPAAFVFTSWAAPIRWYMADPARPRVDQWLAGRTDVHALLLLPLDEEGSEYDAMLRATVHHKPMVNGISGFAPPSRAEISALTKERPMSDRLIDALQAVGVDTIVVRGDLLGPEQEAAVAEWLDRELARGRLSWLASFDRYVRGDHVYRIGKGGMARRPAGTPCRATIGTLYGPDGGATLPKGAIFSGWAISPYGIRSVDLFFNNRRVRYPAGLMPASAEGQCPDNPRVSRADFIGYFEQRPRDIRPHTDIQVEITDGRGERTVLEDRWIEWRRAGS